MIYADEKINMLESDYLTYSTLYAAIKGYIMNNYALEILAYNIDEICYKDDSFTPFEKVINHAITPYRHSYEENLLIELIRGNISNEITINGDTIINAIQDLMDRSII